MIYSPKNTIQLYECDFSDCLCLCKIVKREPHKDQWELRDTVLVNIVVLDGDRKGQYHQRVRFSPPNMVKALEDVPIGEEALGRVHREMIRNPRGGRAKSRWLFLEPIESDWDLARGYERRREVKAMLEMGQTVDQILNETPQTKIREVPKDKWDAEKTNRLFKQMSEENKKRKP